MKLGIEVSIDVTKLDKSKFYQGKKGTYAKLTVFIDPMQADQYGNHGGVYEKLAEGESKDNKNFVGNAKVFWSDGHTQAPQQAAPSDDDFDSQDIPF